MPNITTKLGYMPDICPCCKQSCTYVIPIDRGTAEIMKAIARFIQIKGINVVHPRKELEGHGLSSNQVGNLSRPRMHGLIARFKKDGKPIAGNYVLTSKGAAFLKNEAVPRYAIISKALKHQVGYFEPEKLTCRISDFNEPGEPYWEGVDFEIEAGNIIMRNQPKLL
jgi:hypothetical protein